MNAEANDIGLAALMKVLDFQIRSVKLYRPDKPGVDLNGTMNRTTGLKPPIYKRDRHFTSRQCLPRG